MTRAQLLSVLSGSMARICGADDASDQNWGREAEALVQRALAGAPVVTMDLVDQLDWWQHERISKNSDFPLRGPQ